MVGALQKDLKREKRKGGHMECDENDDSRADSEVPREPSKLLSVAFKDLRLNMLGLARVQELMEISLWDLACGDANGQHIALWLYTWQRSEPTWHFLRDMQEEAQFELIVVSLDDNPQDSKPGCICVNEHMLKVGVRLPIEFDITEALTIFNVASIQLGGLNLLNDPFGAKGRQRISIVDRAWQQEVSGEIIKLHQTLKASILLCAMASGVAQPNSANEIQLKGAGSDLQEIDRLHHGKPSLLADSRPYTDDNHAKPPSCEPLTGDIVSWGYALTLKEVVTLEAREKKRKGTVMARPFTMKEEGGGSLSKGEQAKKGKKRLEAKVAPLKTLQEKKKNCRRICLYTEWAITLSRLEIGGARTKVIDESPEKDARQDEAQAQVLIVAFAVVEAEEAMEVLDVAPLHCVPLGSELVELGGTKTST
ncbi:hypothetical protein ACLOJK_015343 [Asimina triloba]